MHQAYYNLKNNELSDENEYINLKVFFDILVRNKNSIAKINIIGLLIKLFLCSYSKKSMARKFQIFIDQKDNF